MKVKLQSLLALSFLRNTSSMQWVRVILMGIPEEWLDLLPKKEWIIELIEKMYDVMLESIDFCHD